MNATQNPTCAVLGCDRTPVARLLCKAHYQRLVKTGDVQADIPVGYRRRPTLAAGECVVDGCQRATEPYTTRSGQQAYRSICAAHKQRRHRNADPSSPVRDVAPKGSGRLNRDGYKVVYRPRHPMANLRGYALEHRVVLFDHLGDGPHNCRWCGVPLEWSAIEVDHLDGARTNNVIANLAASCGRCNRARARSGNPLDFKADA